MRPITHFAEAVEPHDTQPGVVDSTFSIGSAGDEVELGKWFLRPCVIQSYTWSEGTNIHNVFYPWKDFFWDNLSVRNKLYGYTRLRAKLVLKFVINATPFQYSMAMASYKPLSYDNGTPDSELSDFSGGAIGTDVTTRQLLIGRSQRPNVKLYPQTCTGAEMELPFVYYDNWIEISNTDNGATLKRMGKVNLDSFNSLLSGSSSTSPAVSITVFAYAKDVELSGPSIALQSVDEYNDDGPISAPATAVSRISSLLTSIPVIGPYMTATSVASKYVAVVARAFGYSNPPDLSATEPRYLSFMSGLADTQSRVYSSKLSLDPKNELTIDPRTVGCSPVDDLAVKQYCGRESYLFKTTWEPTDVYGTNLATTYVTPELFDVTSTLGPMGGTYNIAQLTPMAHMSQLFQYWTGDIQFRFQFLCSRFHRGRVRIVYDPLATIGVTDPTLQFNQIVDISETSDFVFRVPYMGKGMWLENSGLPFLFSNAEMFGIRGNPTWIYNPRYANGSLRIEVLNELSAPDTVSDVVVLIYVSACDNFQLAGPKQLANSTVSYGNYVAVQATDEPDPMRTEGNELSGVTDNKSTLVTMGEAFLSARDILHRSILAFAFSIVHETNDRNYYWRLRFPRFPRSPGPYQNGFNQVAALNSITPVRFNIATFTPLNWFTPCFVGHRGGIRWRVTPNGAADSVNGTGTMVLSRYVGGFSGDGIENIGSDLTMNDYALQMGVLTTSAAGSAVCTNYMGALDATVPMYSAKRMYAANPAVQDNPNLWPEQIGMQDDNVQLVVENPRAYHAIPIGYSFWASAGVDFTPFMFLNVPTIYWINGYPLPWENP